jgi:hypothetical protein
VYGELTVYVNTARSWVKIMASVFWDKEGILLVGFLEKGITINTERYKGLQTYCDNAFVNFVLTETRKASFSFTTMPGLTPAYAHARHWKK